MGTKISKKKYLRYTQASDDYDETHKTGDKPFFLLPYDKQSELNGLTPRENWYIYKHSGKLYVTYIAGGEYGEKEVIKAGRG